METKGFVEPLDRRLLLVFTPVTPVVPVGDGPVAIVTADFNRDGKPDVATANSNSNNISILLGNGTGGFTLGLPVGVAAQPSAMAVGDLNRDGKVDLIVGINNSSSIKTYLGDGAGSFTSGATLSAATDSVALAVADINRDGWQDVLVATEQSNNINLLVSDNTGALRWLSSVSSGSTPLSIAVEDVNRDGLPDILTANSGSNNVGIHLGRSTGGYQTSTVSVGTAPRAISVKDINSDGKPDVVTANSTSNNVSILFGDGIGAFSAQPAVALGTSPQKMITADVNGDGQPDIITANSNSTLSVLAGNGNGTFPTVKTIETTQANALAAADLNADGKPEILLTDFNADSVGVLLNRSANHSSGTFAQPGELSSLGTSTFHMTADVGDVNGDGIVDLIPSYWQFQSTGNPIHSSRFVARVGNGSGGFTSRAPFTYLESPFISTYGIFDFNSDGRSDIAYPLSSGGMYGLLADVNGDYSLMNRVFFNPGPSILELETAKLNSSIHNDVVIAHSGTSTTDRMTIYLRNGNGSYTQQPAFDVGTLVQSFKIFDINKDGIQDLLIASRTGAFGVRLGNGSGIFSPYTSVAMIDGIVEFNVTDINGDTNLDILAINNVNNTIDILLGNGTGGFTTGTKIDLFSRADSIDTADVNGDRIPDITATNGSLNSIVVLQGNGSGGFTTRPAIAVDMFVIDASIADFNLDGKLDLYLITSGSTSKILLGNGNGDFFPTPNPNILVNDKPDVIAIADINGDAANDLLSVNDSDGNLGVFTGNGTGSFSPISSSPITTQSIPSSIATSDVNADGRMDILIGSSFSSEEIRVLLANSTGSFITGPFFSHTESINSFALADFNRDGKVDLATANKTSSTSSDSITLFSGNGSGGFSSPQTSFTFFDGAVSIAVADFNRDGIPDVVTTESLGNSVTVFLGDGNGLILSRLPYSVGTKPVSVAVADFNGDGCIDIATANQTSNNVSILLGNGAGLFTTPTSFAVGSSPKNLSIADVNGDGKQDIVTANAVGKSISILLGTGTGGFGTATSIPIGVTPNFVTLADINRDNAVDIIYSNNDNENVSYLFNQRSRPTKLQLSAQANTRPGNSIPLVIEALTQNNQLSSTYTGSVRLTSTDPAAVLTAGLAYSVDGNVSFSAGDLGSRTVQIKLSTLGTQTITATDVVTGSIVGSITVNVTDSLAPTDLNISSSAVLENQPSGTTVGTLTTTDLDSGSSFTYSLVSGVGSTDNASFTIIGDKLQTAAAFNFLDKSVYNIRIRTINQSGLFFEKSLTINILQANVAPTNLALTNSTIPENLPGNFAVGSFITTDANSGDLFAYSLVTGTGSTDNSLFSINGSTLIALVTFDFEGKTSYSVRVRVTDQGGLFFDKALTISVVNVNEKPTDIEITVSLRESDPVGTLAGTFSTKDPDFNNSFTYSLVSGDGDFDNSFFEIQGNKLVLAEDLSFFGFSSLWIRIRSTDQGGLSTDKKFVIELLNSSPTNLSLSPTSFSEDKPFLTSVGTFTTTDADPDDFFFYSLVPGSGSADNFSFEISNNNLLTSDFFDFESKTSYSIRVRTTDSRNNFFEKSFTINITNVNEAPHFISLAASSIAENNLIGITIGEFATSDSDLVNTFTYSLVNGAGSTDNAKFSIFGDFLRAASSFNFEEKSSFSFRIRSTDNTGLFLEKVFTLGLTNVNEAPTNINLSTSGVDEAQPVGTLVGTLSTTDPDSGNTFTYAFVTGTGATDNTRFTISGDKLLTAANFNFETKSSYSVRVRTTDQNGLSFTKVFTININNVNETPANVALSGTSIAESKPIGTAIGEFSSTDPDIGNTFTYSLVAGTGDTDNASFAISGNTLISAAVLDFESKAAYSVRIRSTDQGGASIDKVFTITTTNENEAPVSLSLAANGVAENQPIGTPIGSFTTQDPDSGNTFTYSFVSGTGDADNSRFAIVGSALHTAEVLDFETKATYSVRIRATDQGGLFIEKDLIVIVSNANDAPNNILLSGNILAENQPIGTPIGSLTASDQDAGNTFTYTLVSGSGSTHNALFLIAGTILQSVGSLDFDLQPNYSIRVRATDQTGLFSEKVFNVLSTNVNEPPTEIALTPISIAENTPVGTMVGSFVTSDPDAGSSFTYSLVSGIGDADNSSFSISGSTLLAAVTFDFETKSSYTVRVKVVDQGGLATEKAIVIGVINANETPLEIGLSSPGGVSITGATLAENLPPGAVVGIFNTADLDSSNSFTYSLVSGEGDADNVSFSISGSSLVTTAALDFESKNTYTLRISSTDQGGLSTEQIFSVTVINANDAPSGLLLTRDGAAQSQTANSILGTFSTSDQDAGNTFSYSLVAGSGDSDNTLFAISGDTLSTAPGFSPTKRSYSVRVRATDQDGLFTEQSLSIAFTSQLSFLNVPANGLSTITLSPVLIRVNDLAGTVLTGDSSQITLAVSSGPAGAALAGTLTVNAVNGVATFSDLTVSLPGTYSFIASANGLPAVVSAEFDIAPPNISLMVERGTGLDTSPDMTLAAVKFKPVKGTVFGGTTLSGSLTLRNSGSVTMTGSTSVQFLFSNDSIPSTFDVSASVISTGNLKLSPGKTRSVPFTLTVPSGIQGSYQLLALANPSGQLAEKTTLNNSMKLRDINVESASVNLKAGSALAKSSVAPGKALAVSLPVLNMGNQPINSGFQISATFIDGATGASTSLGTFTSRTKLLPGRSASVRLNVLFPTELTGKTGELVMTIDPSGALGEIITNDNTSKLNISVA